jgi:putative hydrolase of the HAD superfamily
MKLQRPIETIFFDIGDTLVYDDPPLFDRVRSALSAAGVTYDPDGLLPAYRKAEDHAMRRYLEGVPFDSPETLAAASAIILAELGTGGIAPETLPSMGTHYAAIGYARRLHPTAAELLIELQRRGFALGVISDWEADLPDLLVELGIRAHFRAVAVSAIVGCTKPHARLFADALGQAGANPATSVHVGDYYELDVAGARSVGIQPLLFDWKQRHPSADCARVETFAELAEALLQL